MTPAHEFHLYPVMASDGSPAQDSPKKKKKTSRKARSEGVKDAEVQEEVQVEKLTACGHSALQRGDNSKALEYFKKAFKTAVNVRKVLRDSFLSSKDVLVSICFHAHGLYKVFLCFAVKKNKILIPRQIVFPAQRD